MLKTFYWSSTRKLTSVFGSLFNDIKIVRRDSSDTELARYLVPIQYSPKNSWYYSKELRSADYISGSGPNVKTMLPRISFEMTEMNYNESRKTNTMNVMASNIAGDTLNKSKMFAPVPYDFTYDLIVYSKYIEDGLQIVEQIIPYFSPSLNVKIKEMEDPLVYNDVQVTLEGVISEDNFEETLDTNRVLTWTFTFRCAANVYPPIDDTKIIRKSIVNIDNSLIDPPGDLETIQVEAHAHETDDIEHSTTTIIDDTSDGASPSPTGEFSDEFSDEFS